VTSAGGLTVRVDGPELAAAAAAALAGLRAEGVPAALSAGDAGLWGPAAVADAAERLGWLQLPTSSRALLGPLADLVAGARADGLHRVVLAGMGGSSLAPEVICRAAGVALVVLDTTDPGQVRAALNGGGSDGLAGTLVVVSSKSGGTVETRSHQAAFAAAFAAAGLTDAEVGRRFIAVTDPGSPLERLGREQGFRSVVLADPRVGGRYSALSAFGLVPAALAGADVGGLLDEAAALAGSLAGAEDNPALELGAALGAAGAAGRDKVLLVERPGSAGLGDWAEQLLAESTGKNGRGLLPVVATAGDPGTAAAPDRVIVALDGAAGGPGREQVAVAGPLGAAFLAFEYATAVAGRLLDVNPFDQPNVAESKDNTARILAAGIPTERPAFVDGAVEGYAPAALLDGARDVPGALAALLARLPERGYLAVMAYLDRHRDAAAAGLRSALAARTDRVVTFGWGPRFLHSTGQYHKGGPPTGGFLQITGAVAEDLPVPGEAYTFGQLQAAQAAGDRQALAGRGRPLLRLHLTDRAAGLRQLLAAADRDAR